jgi:hypothetical protein
MARPVRAQMREIDRLTRDIRSLNLGPDHRKQLTTFSSTSSSSPIYFGARPETARHGAGRRLLSRILLSSGR